MPGYEITLFFFFIRVKLKSAIRLNFEWLDLASHIRTPVTDILLCNVSFKA